MELNFPDIISILYAFSAVLLIVFLLGAKTERPLSNRLLAAYLFVSIFDASSHFLSLLVYSRSPIAGMLMSETVYFLIPLFYLFIKASVFNDFKLTPKALLHGLPYLAINALLIPGFFIPLLKNPEANWVELIYETNLHRVIYISIHLQQYVYYFFIFRLLWKYKKLLLENFSSPKLDNPRWLTQITLLFLINEVLAMLKNIIRFNSSYELYMIAQNTVSALALLLMVWLIFKALRNPGIFAGVHTATPLVQDMVNAEEKVTAENNELIARLKSYMEQNEPYLDSSLSMHDLAKQLDVPVRELSVSINHTLNKHFFDFVNEYRIEKAKEIIRNSTDEKQTILEVLYEVGFNSKSSFNTAFKKHTGLTPTEFKKKASLRVA